MRCGGLAAAVLSILVAGCSAEGEGDETQTIEQAFTAFDLTIQAEHYAVQNGTGLEGTQDAGGGQNVGWIDAGDWLAYDVTLPETQTYRVSYRVASLSAGGRIQIERRGGGQTYGTIDVPVTGGWQNWTTITQEITIPAGSVGIGLVALQGGFNINWFRIEAVGAPASGATVEAEDFANTSNLEPFVVRAEQSRTFLEWPGEGQIFSTPSDRSSGQTHYFVKAEASTLSLFATVNMPHAGSDSFFYKLEGATEWARQNNVQTSGFQEIPFATIEGLNPGQTYILKISRREDGAQLDKFRVEGGTFEAEGPEPGCGNGIIEGGEACDDGNTTPGDGCDASCREEASPIAQAEDYLASSPFSPFEVRNEGGIAYIEWPGGGGGLYSPSDSADGQAHFTVTPTTATLDLFATVNMQHAGDDSFFYKLEGHSDWILQNNVQTNGFSEISVGSFSGLTVGQPYTLKILRREDGTKIDKFRVEGGYFGDAPPIVVGCGNGIVEDDEECDDGNQVGTDACQNDCTYNLVATASPPVEAAPGGLRRLLRRHYVRSVGGMFGPESAAVAGPPADPKLGAAEMIAAFEIAITPVDVEQFERSALDVAHMATSLGEPGQLAPCLVSGPFGESDRDSCYGQLIERLGMVAYRRPVVREEREALLAIAQLAETAATDYVAPDHCDQLPASEVENCTALARGATYVIATLLQSPSFLYSVELGVPGAGGNRVLDPYTLLSRISLMLRGRFPSESELLLAEAGALSSEGGIETVVAQMLSDDLAREGFRDHFDEILGLNLLATRGKDATIFPNFNAALKASMEEEVHLFVDDIVFDNPRSFLDIFTSESRYVDPLLAQNVYGIAPPASGSFELVDFSASGLAHQGRAGILTFPALLSVDSHAHMNSPTRRGVRTLAHLLCINIPPPPPDVNLELPDPGELSTTLRDHLENIHAQGSCAGCHDIMDPIGFAFEHFDAMGAHRELDNGFPVDSSGVLSPLLGGSSFSGSRDLAQIVANDPGLPGCLIDQIHRNVAGSPTSDPAPLSDLEDAFVQSNHDMQVLLAAWASSPIFREVSDPR